MTNIVQVIAGQFAGIDDNGYITGAKGIKVPSVYVGNSGSETLLGSSSGLPGVVMSIIGDSEMANGTVITDGGKQVSTVNCGPATMAQILSGRRITSPVANNHSVGGTTWPSIVNQLPAALADNPDFILMDGGTNDAASGTALGATLSAMFSAVQQTLAAGVIPILVPVTPRTLGYTTAVAQFIESYNQVLQELALGRSDIVANAGLPAHKYPVVLDGSACWNYTGSGGAANPGIIGTDGLHGQFGYGVLFGAQIAQLVNSIRPATPTTITTPYDIYNAASLANGSLLNAYSGANDGMMQGTGGTTYAQHGVTPSGNVANGWQALCSSAGSTGTSMTLSKENPRTDGLVSGERQRVQIAQGSGGSGFETFNLNYKGGGAGIASNISPGDTVYFECRVQVNSCVGLAGIQAQLYETGPASPQTFVDGSAASNAGVGLGSAQYPQLLAPMILRTPPMTLQAGITNLTPQIIISMYAGTGYALDCDISDCAVRKMVAN